MVSTSAQKSLISRPEAKLRLPCLRVPATAGQRKTRLTFTANELSGAGSRSVPISFSRDCCARKSATDVPSRGEVGVMRDEEPSGAVSAQVPAVAVGAAVKLLAADVVHCNASRRRNQLLFMRLVPGSVPDRVPDGASAIRATLLSAHRA
jgi:hypothetical protein